jgi:hypothetical protein
MIAKYPGERSLIDPFVLFPLVQHCEMPVCISSLWNCGLAAGSAGLKKQPTVFARDQTTAATDKMSHF